MRAFCAHLFDRQNAWVANHKKATQLKPDHTASANNRQPAGKMA